MNESLPSSPPVLIINTGGEDRAIGLWQGNGQFYQSLGDDGQLSSSLLIKIDQLLTKHHRLVNDLGAIIVATGPGRFTAIKIGLAVANALAWSVGCPIYGVTSDQLPQTTKDFNRIISHPSRIAKPTLEPPNTTVPRPKT